MSTDTDRGRGSILSPRNDTECDACTNQFKEDDNTGPMNPTVVVHGNRSFSFSDHHRHFLRLDLCAAEEQ